MTPVQVAEATEGMARVVREDLPREGRDPRVGNRGKLQSSITEFAVRYYYDHRGLAQIELVPEFDDCDAVYTELVATYGNPLSRNEQIILRTIVWHDEVNQNHILLIHSTAGVCEINFTPLSGGGVETAH